MQLKDIFIAAVVTLSFSACVSSTDLLPATSLNPYGRYLYSNNNHIELISSAAHVGFSFIGNECHVYAYISNPEGHNYLQYELDGVYQKRVKISGASKLPFNISTTTPGRHTVWLYKATEAHTGPIYIEKVTGKDLISEKNTSAPLIEFIGNSITCGAAADPSEVPCGTGVYHDQHNAYYAYGPRVARALKTNFLMSSVSGIGIYRNWNSNGPAMPQVYEDADFQERSQRPWSFEQYKPAIVSIALGTNDFSDGDGKHERLPFDSSIFVREYIKFVKVVKSHYPETQIALLSSPMIHGDRRTTLQNCLMAVEENINKLYPSDKAVAVFFFNPMEARGCTGHPNVEDHAVLAEELIPFFKKLL